MENVCFTFLKLSVVFWEDIGTISVMKNMEINIQGLSLKSAKVP